MPTFFTPALIDQIIKGRCPHLASILGMRKLDAERLQVTVFLPRAQKVEVLSSNGKKVLGELPCLHSEGLFHGAINGKRKTPYRLRSTYAGRVVEHDDPYRFGALLESAELQLLQTDKADHSWQQLGARVRHCNGVDGVHFVVWAPAAQRVSVLMEQADWDGRALPMYPHAESGWWELFVPNLSVGARYRLQCLQASALLKNWSFDPFALAVSEQPDACSQVAVLPAREWHDHIWRMRRQNQTAQAMPLVFREFCVDDAVQQSNLHWSQLAEIVLPLWQQQGCTHLVLKGLHPQITSRQGLQISYLAAAPRLGELSDLQDFIEHAHQRQVGLMVELSLLDWFKQHLAEDLLDGGYRSCETHLSTLQALLLAYVGYWAEQLHVDGFVWQDLDALLALLTARQANERGVGNLPPRRWLLEWFTALLQRLRDVSPALLLVVVSQEVWPELTLARSKGGCGVDYRLLPSKPATAAPASAASLNNWLQQQLQRAADGNSSYILQQITPLLSADDALLQIQMLAQWTLPGRLWLSLPAQLQLQSAWQPEQGHDWRYVEHAMPATCVALMQQLCHVYAQTPALYEQDATHEGLHLLHMQAGVVIYERSGRHDSDYALVVLNTSDSMVPVPLARLPSRLLPSQLPLLQLSVSVGRQGARLPPCLQGVGSAAHAELLLPAVSGALYLSH